MSSDCCGEVQTVDLLHDQISSNIIEDDSNTSEELPNDIRLQDIEEQLEKAESRCNNLKNQLDYMKQIYGSNRIEPTKNRKISHAKKLADDKETINDTTTIIADIRQTSDHIETDNTGAAVKTINNILNGITNSVNRLSEIHSQLTSPQIKMSTAVSTKEELGSIKFVGIVPELKIESTNILTPKTRGQKRKAAKSIKTPIQHSLKQPARIEKKTRSVIARSNTGLENKSSTIIRSRYLSKLNSKNNNLVEIYHNKAVKNSDSDESNLKKSRQHDRAKSEMVENDIPPLNIQAANAGKSQQYDQSAKSDSACPNGFRNSFSCDPPHVPRTTISCCYSRNYELPTVASKMKQVAKSYLGTLNLKSIPFCAAISTTQSHNIGINIQQVMNIIKNRQPIHGISPTLAHNIGLAAEKLNSKPFSALVSSINSKISHAVSKCPLSNTFLNMQQLQEQAKNIVEETIEEGEEEEASESPQTHTMIITGPSGDMEIETKNVPNWKVDKSNASEQCTCISQPGIGFQQIANRYQRNIRTITENSLNTQNVENQLKKRLRRYKITKTSFIPKESKVQESQVQTATTVNQECQKESTLRGREKNLKEVLANLHHDFDSLNKRYEDLSQINQSDGDDTTIKELERLEVELNKKEEEITMVMTLYKEVLALKQQIQQLRDKRSESSLPSKATKETKIKFKEYNNPEAAFHLTKLLKQIQHYQSRYRSNLSQE
ncbi:uncharacterized protein LOC109544910 isoform X1 [Dendroctonus ponderosae]|uniref:Cep57 centrosome localisation domain-containing protein n=1 Tax=Dendroctonus ponderosae TaxID=77166 RepID=A0AAR5QCE4_DENPD|nr:uncharacterized protein LOC109544910 isoform X1 [Dendroctonus ponderosae]KAH1003556.1 hypothetical protein HUJ04_003459 [Dendroctonus ponderosae]